jgi:hypothetical protein
MVQNGTPIKRMGSGDHSAQDLGSGFSVLRNESRLEIAAFKEVRRLSYLSGAAEVLRTVLSRRVDWNILSDAIVFLLCRGCVELPYDHFLQF